MSYHQTLTNEYFPLTNLSRNFSIIVVNTALLHYHKIVFFFFVKPLTVGVIQKVDIMGKIRCETLLHICKHSWDWCTSIIKFLVVVMVCVCVCVGGLLRDYSFSFLFNYLTIFIKMSHPVFFYQWKMTNRTILQLSLKYISWGALDVMLSET